MKNLPPRPYRSADISQVEPDMRSFLQEIIDDPRRAMTRSPMTLIYGPEGSGKTHAVSALAMAMVAKRWLVSYFDCTEVPRDKQELAALAEDIEHRGSLLILDDLGKEPEGSRDVFITAVRQRINAGRMLIVSCNLTVDLDDLEACRLTQLYGRSNRSRLLSGNVVLLDGMDRRLPGKEW